MCAHVERHQSCQVLMNSNPGGGRRSVVFAFNFETVGRLYRPEKTWYNKYRQRATYHDLAHIVFRLVCTALNVVSVIKACRPQGSSEWSTGGEANEGSASRGLKEGEYRTNPPNER